MTKDKCRKISLKGSNTGNDINLIIIFIYNVFMSTTAQENATYRYIIKLQILH